MRNVVGKSTVASRFTFLVALVAAGFALYGAWSFKTLKELQVNGPLYGDIVQMKDLVADVLPPPAYIVESYLVVLQLATNANVSERPALIEHLKKLRSEYVARQEFWQQQKLAPSLADPLLKDAYEPGTMFFRIAFNEFVPALQRDEIVVAQAHLPRLAAAYKAHRAAIDQVVERANRRTVEVERAAADQITSSTYAMLAILLLSLSAVIAVAVGIARSVLRPLRTAVAAAETVASGDLSGRTGERGTDETGQLLQSLDRMNANLSGIVSRVRRACGAIDEASNEIARGTQELSSRAEEQASSLEQTAASMEELTVTVKRNADSAHEASQLAAVASEAAAQGSTAAGEVVSTMSAMHDASRKVADISGIIDSIAFQTNILALNAAVEAARAGEQGRGFAVVASEVRLLAQRSAESAREIRKLIDASVQQAESGNALARRAGATMKEVGEKVHAMARLVNDIAAASAEQRMGIEQVSQAVSQIETVTQQNASLAEETAAASDAMRQQATRLMETVEAFRLSSQDDDTWSTEATGQAAAPDWPALSTR
jgi:methyl-accepting chemotaxis protein